jgi:hypothetical protein
MIGWTQAGSKEELRIVEPKAQEIRKRYMCEPGGGCKGTCRSSQVEQGELFAKMCESISGSKISATGTPSMLGRKIEYVVKDAKTWNVDIERYD